MIKNVKHYVQNVKLLPNNNKENITCINPECDDFYDKCTKLCVNCKIIKNIFLNTEKLICTNTKCIIFYDKWLRDGHLRFNFDAQDDNKKIIELFNDFFKDNRCIVHSHKGNIWIQIVLLDDYLKYDYQYAPYKLHYNYVYYDYPYQIVLEYTGSPTVSIIKDLIIKINNNDYNENSLCSVEIINNDI